MKHSVVFVAAKRTPFGAFGGSLKTLSATELGVHASAAVLKEAKLSPSSIDQVIFGNVMQTSPDAIYLARHVGLKSGVPQAVPAVTVNRLCGSGFEAIIQGARLIQTEEAKVVLTGGAESMSQAPYVLRGARFGYRMNHQELEDSLMAGLYDPVPALAMALTAENLATKYSISRAECDAFALRSQKLAAAAVASGALAEEIAPVRWTERGKEKTLERDEHIRPDASPEALAKLKPVFKPDGVVTAGNASGMVDGACALVLASRSDAEKQGWPILGEFLGSHVTGCDPAIMGIGPVTACRGLLERHKLDPKELALIEINEAFAAQTLAVQKELRYDSERLNAEGGAISIGHPLGASGARLTTHLLHALRRRGGGLGLGSACIGGGQGIALLLKV